MQTYLKLWICYAGMGLIWWPIHIDGRRAFTNFQPNVTSGFRDAMRGMRNRCASRSATEHCVPFAAVSRSMNQIRGNCSDESSAIGSLNNKQPLERDLERVFPKVGEDRHETRFGGVLHRLSPRSSVYASNFPTSDMDGLDRCGELAGAWATGKTLHRSAAATHWDWALVWDHPMIKHLHRTIFGSFWGSTGPQTVINPLGITSPGLQFSKTRHIGEGFGCWGAPYTREQSISICGSELKGRHIRMKTWEGLAVSGWLEGPPALEASFSLAMVQPDL